MPTGRSLLMLSVVLLVVSLQVTDGRPHIRHQRGGSHCSRCGPGWGAVSPCARGRDVECRRCAPGTYSPHHSTQPCWICSRCGPGLYEARACTSRSDTVCDSCHRHAPDNADYRRKCKGRGFFLAPEDAESTGEESALVNEPASQVAMDDRDDVLEEDATASSSIFEEDSEMIGSVAKNQLEDNWKQAKR